MYEWFTRTQKRKYRLKYTNQPDTDCWWSKHPEGKDTQIIVIGSPDGPRIRMTVKTAPGSRRSTITVTDRRKYLVAGERKRTWTVPANLKPSFRGKE
jgi:hypothetical protein